MKPPPFRYEKPKSVQDLTNALATYGEDARILAGGQSLVPMMNFRTVAPDVLIDINGLAELDFIRVEKGELRLGALTRHNAIAGSELVRETCPLIIDAYQHIANKTIRNRGTIGGNLSHCDPASEMPAVMQCLEAKLILRSAVGERMVPAAEFFVGPFKTALTPTEALIEIRIRVRAGEGWAFLEVSPRKGDFAIVAICATVSVSRGRCDSARLAHAGVASHAARLHEAEAVLIGQTLDEKVISKAAGIAASTLDPEILNYHGDAEYKVDLVRTLCTRALSKAHSNASN